MATGANTHKKDGGWAWLVVAGGFGVQFITLSLTRSLGNLIIDWQEVFQCQMWVLTSLISVNLLLLYVLAPIGNALSVRFSTCAVVFVGGLMITVGFALASVAPSLPWFFVFHGLVVGIGCGLVYSPSIIIIAEYFEKRRGIALGIAHAGAACGNFILPLLTRYFVNTYGLWGTELLLGGIAAQTCVCAMAFRPVRRNTTKPITSVETETNNEELKDLYTNVLHENANSNNLYRSQDKMEGDSLENMQSVEIYHKRHNENESASNNSISILPQHKQHETIKQTNCCLKISKYFNWRLFCNPIFVIYFIPGITFGPTWEVANTLVTSEAIAVGYSKETANFLASVVGLSDFVYRLAVGLIADWFDRCIPTRYLFCSFAVLTGFNASIFPLIDNYSSFIICCVIYGICGASNCVLSIVVVAQIVDPKDYASAYGFLYLVQAGTATISAQLIGVLRDVTHNWHASFWFVGSITMIGGSVGFVYPLVARYQKTKIKQVPLTNDTRDQILVDEMTKQ